MISVAREEKLWLFRLVDTCKATGVHVAGTDETQKIPLKWSPQRL